MVYVDSKRGGNSFGEMRKKEVLISPAYNSSLTARRV